MRTFSTWMFRALCLTTFIVVPCWLVSFWWSFGVGMSWTRADQQYFQAGIDIVDGQFQLDVMPFHFQWLGLVIEPGIRLHSRFERTVRVEHPNPFLPHRRDGLFRAGQVRGTTGPGEYLVFIDGLVAIPVLAVLTIGCFYVRRNADGRCHCGYSLSGLTTNTCPECGRTINKPAEDPSTNE